MKLFKFMPLEWHVIWVIAYLLAYVIMLGSGWMSHHVLFLGQQSIAFIGGGMLSGLTYRLWNPLPQDKRQ